MRKDLTQSIRDLEIAHRAAEHAAELEERYGLPPDVARRIVDMARSIDQAHAIAELMK
jgi:hypothetical protein